METNKTQTEQLTQDAVMQSVFKASDLRVGNLINVLNPNTGIWNIEATKGKTIMILQQEEGHYLLINNLKPIPITEEWLLKFGFIKTEYKSDIIYDSGLQSSTYITIDNDYSSYFMWGEYLTSIKYVHELQNLYFALTQRELTVA
jgi:hypothetical protein